ncbi:ABC transporter substrate-binding protein [Rhodobacter sp.]
MKRVKHNRGRSTLGRLALALGLSVSATLLVPSLAVAQDRPLIIARDMDLNSLDPHRSWCDTCQIYNTAVYEALVTLDAENKLVPLIAESWSSNEAQTEFTFVLNPAAKFADGSPVEVKDVIWTFSRLQNLQESGSWVVEPISAMEVVDERSVKFTLKSANSEFPNAVASQMLGILNSDVVIENGGVADETAPTADQAEAWLMTNSAGSGPFVLSEYEPNADLRLARNDNYWGKPAAVSEVVFRQVKDAVAQAQMLQSGSVDVAMQIDPETAKTLEGSAVEVSTSPSFNFIYLLFGPGAPDNEVPLTNEVRKAITMAIDREALIDMTLSGAGQIISAPIPLGYPGGDGHAAPEYNPEKAKEMLAAAGHPDGFKLKSIYPDMNLYSVDFNLAMQKIQQDLAKIGVQVELSPMPLATWREHVNGEGIPMTMIYYAPDNFTTSQYVDFFGMFEGSLMAKRATGSGDPALVLNTKIGAIRDAALAAPTQEEANAKWFEAGEMMIDDHIVVPMVSPDVLLAYVKGVKGVRYSACCNLPLAEISFAD